MTIPFSNSGASLVIAHPGHELCVYGWLETVRPQVFVLTDGSGRAGTSRLDSTTKILAQAGARRGSIYGRFTDHNIYRAILDGDFRLFEELVTELAEALVEAEVEYVVGDAVEGYNPVHDTCRIVIDAAVELAGRIGGRPIINREFLLYARHSHQEEQHADAILLTLDDEMLARKLEVARAYPELQAEVDAMLDKQTLDALKSFPELSEHFNDVVTSTMGEEAYRVECLRPASGPAWSNGPPNEVPVYQQYGELLVASGVYNRAIRYRDHIIPLVEAIRSLIGVKPGTVQGQVAGRA